MQIKGAPGRSRGAWTAAILAQQHLRTTGSSDGESTEVSLGLAAALLGCETKEPSELTRAKRTAGKPDRTKLLDSLIEEWNFWCEHSVLKQEEARMPPARRQDHLLTFFLARLGTLAFSTKALARMPSGVWEAIKVKDCDSRSLFIVGYARP